MLFVWQTGSNFTEQEVFSSFTSVLTSYSSSSGITLQPEAPTNHTLLLCESQSNTSWVWLWLEKILVKSFLFSLGQILIKSLLIRTLLTDRSRREDERKILKMSKFNLLPTTGDTAILLNFRDSVNRQRQQLLSVQNLCSSNRVDQRKNNMLTNIFLSPQQWKKQTPEGNVNDIIRRGLQSAH